MLSTPRKIIPVIWNLLPKRNLCTVNSKLSNITYKKANPSIITSINQNNSSRFNSTLCRIAVNPTIKTLNYFIPVRYKGKSSKKHQKEPDSSESEIENDEDESIDKSSKVMTIRVSSLRLDGIIKSGLGIARNKIEVLFYESKIRLNGEKVLKKSASVQAGDEIDVIKGFSPSNNKFLIVARIEVLNTVGEDEHITMKIRRCKTLMVENYEVPYKASSASSSS